MSIYLTKNEIREVLNDYISNQLYDGFDVKLRFGISELEDSPYYSYYAQYTVYNTINICGKEYKSDEIVPLNEKIIFHYLKIIFGEAGYFYKSSSCDGSGIRFNLIEKPISKKLVKVRRNYENIRF